MIIMFLANGFEETEAFAPLDILRRAGLEVKTVSINDTREVTGAHGMRFTADAAIADLDTKGSYEAVILPGGMPGTTNLGACEGVRATLLESASHGALLAAICAAPSVLGELGLLRGKDAVCYPGFEDRLEGARVLDAQVVVDGSVITARAMGAAFEFGLALVTKLCDASVAQRVAASAFIK